MDRLTPHKQISDNANDWTYRQTHTAAPFFHTNGTDGFILTADEFFLAKFNLVSVGTVPLASSSGRWVNGVDPILYDGTNEDDRRLGAFLRVWKTATDDGEIEAVDGVGSYDGPLSLYDPIESVEPDNLYFSSRKEVGTLSIAVACTTSTAEEIAPNTVHRVYTIDPYNNSMYTQNANDAILSAYASGCRVVNLGLTPSDGITFEKAFFDFIPRLSYDKNSDYFYKIFSGGSNSLDPEYLALNNIAMYFYGVWHSVPDFGLSRVGTNGTGTLPTDEKFIYAMGFGEGRIWQDDLR